MRPWIKKLSVIVVIIVFLILATIAARNQLLWQFLGLVAIGSLVVILVLSAKGKKEVHPIVSLVILGGTIALVLGGCSLFYLKLKELADPPWTTASGYKIPPENSFKWSIETEYWSLGDGRKVFVPFKPGDRVYIRFAGKCSDHDAITNPPLIFLKVGRGDDLNFRKFWVISLDKETEFVFPKAFASACRNDTCYPRLWIGGCLSTLNLSSAWLAEYKVNGESRVVAGR